MTIESPEQAKDYLDEVHRHLDELTQLSIDAGMNTHASIWLVISAAFFESIDEVKTITDMMNMYCEHKLGLRKSKES